MSIDYAKYVSELVARAKAAQAIADGYTQERVDELCAAIAYRTTRPEWAQQAAEMLVAESGMGIVEHKVAKIYTKVKGGYRDMKGKKSVGLVEENKETGVKVYARPMGVIGAIMPVTNGEATRFSNPFPLSRAETPSSLHPIRKQQRPICLLPKRFVKL